MLNDKTSPAVIAGVIQAALEERTLSLEAIDAIKVMRDTLSKAEEKIVTLESAHKINSAHSQHMTDSLNAALDDLKAFQDREQALLAREVICMKIEVENEYLVKGNADKMTIMLSLTRNLEYRRSLSDSKSGSELDGRYVNTSVNAEETSEKV
jgi:hypothetical protein